MKAAFPDYGAVRAAPPAALAASIRAGGLADRKAAVIQALLAAVHAEAGGTSLDHVRGWDAERVKSYLTAFDGVGPKTASCVLAFALGAADFPVDVHVHRAATAVLGWAPKAAGRDAVYHHLNARIPDDIKVRLHVLMVEHGKRCAACGGGRGGGEGAPGKAVAKCCLRSAVAAARAADRECGGGVKVEEQGAVPDPGLFSPQPAKKRRVKREEEEGAGGAPPPATTPAAGVAAPKTDASPVKPTRSLAGGGGGGGRARRRL
jgi:endonuclease III